MKKSALKYFLLSLAAVAVTSNAADDRYFIHPVSDTGGYRAYSWCCLNNAVDAKKSRHTGHDYNNAQGAEIKAVGSGRISAVMTPGNLDHGLGNSIIIEHQTEGFKVSQLYSTYAHLNGFAAGISVGTYVAKGQVIGYMGKSGASNNIVHLHFEMKSVNTPQDKTYKYTGYVPEIANDPSATPDYWGYFKPTTAIGNSGVKYKDYQLSNVMPPSAKRNQFFSWYARINNPFSFNGRYDARLILEKLDGSLVGEVGAVYGHTANYSGLGTLTFTKSSGFSSPSGDYNLRLQYRAYNGNGVWQTLPTYNGVANPSRFALQFQ